MTSNQSRFVSLLATVMNQHYSDDITRHTQLLPAGFGGLKGDILLKKEIINSKSFP
jgi:hypothetical protein